MSNTDGTFGGRREDLAAWQAVHQAIGYIEGRIADGAAADDVRTHEALGKLLPGLIEAGEALNRPAGELRLYRLRVDVYVHAELAPTLTYLVRAESPAAAASLVMDRVTDSWLDHRSAEIVGCWSYPPGELVLAGADMLELAGERIPVADLGKREASPRA